MAIKRLTEEDFAIVAELCERAGVAPVLQALAERCAFEANAPRAPAGWQEAFGTVLQATQQVSDLEAAR